jgi:prevent-host-death family protein
LYVLYKMYESQQLSVSEARQDFAELVNRAAYRGERIVVSRRGRPVAAIVPIEDYARLEAAEEIARNAGQAQAEADRVEVRRLVAMSDRDREAYYLASNRNMLAMMADARRSR